jgi:hypothetical protein
VVEKYGCVVMEVEDWIDGINQPAWQRGLKQITGPGLPAYSLEAAHVVRVRKASNQNSNFPNIPPPSRDSIEEPHYL